MSKKTTDSQAPDDLIAIGHITGAHGVQGWVRIRPYSEDAQTLLTVKEWWLNQPSLHKAEVLRTRMHVDEVLARLSTIGSREEAEVARGTLVQVSRSLFPDLDDDEFYWIDLIGLQVINLDGELLGVVHDLMDNGVHQVLRVEAEKTGDSDKRREILIPFVDRFLGEIDIKAGKITVDWESDY